MPNAMGELMISVAKSRLEEGALLTVDAARQRIRLFP
jgi:hypothetical protein